VCGRGAVPGEGETSRAAGPGEANRGGGPRTAGQSDVLRRHFTGRPSRVIRTPDEAAAFETYAVADLPASVERFPGDPCLLGLVDELRSVSPRFAELWARTDVAASTSQLKTVEHPEAGRLTLDCDVLEAAGSTLRLVVYTAAPGAPDHQALELLAAVGSQTFG
jgi:hypothetical protein